MLKPSSGLLSIMIMPKSSSGVNPRQIKWFAKAAEQGIAEASLRLGLKYYYGDGVKQDRKSSALDCITWPPNRKIQPYNLSLG